MESVVFNPLNCNSEKLRYFVRESVKEIIDIPLDHPDAGNILSVVLDSEILSLKIISGMRGLSHEGQYLSGKKVAAEIRLRHKILYVSEREPHSAHILEYDRHHVCYVVIPPAVEGTDPELLLKHGILQCSVNAEDIFPLCMGRRKITIDLCLLVTIFNEPAHEICASMKHIFIMHNDGTHAVKLTSDDTCGYFQPRWSPCGREISYISRNNREQRQLISIYSLKTGEVRPLTLISDFLRIGSYSWLSDGKEIVFSGFRFDKYRELYSIASDNSKLKQLTCGYGEFESYKPKASPQGGYIAFIRSMPDSTDLWLMDCGSWDSIKLTDCGGVKFFDWSPDGRSVIYANCRPDESDQLFVMDIEKLANQEIHFDFSNPFRRKIKFCPNGSAFAFIGHGNGSDNVYKYDLTSGGLTDLTYGERLEISDFVWSADSDRIYFSANAASGSTVYSVDVEGRRQCRIISSESKKIELSYRGRIC